MVAQVVLEMAEATINGMIRTIQIDRFKSLHHTLPAEMGQVTLLTGANGRGKSSFCQALLVLSQTWRRGWMDSLLPNGVWKNLGEYDEVVNAFDPDKTIGFHITTDTEQDNDYQLLFKKSDSTPSLGEVVSVRVNGRPIHDDSGSSDDGEYEGDGADDDDGSENILLASLSDFPSLMSLQRMFYVAAERVAAPEGQPIDEATPFEYLAPNGSNVLKALWANRESGCIESVQELLGRILDGGGLRLDNDGTRLTLKINSVDDGAFYQPVNVGYGYSYILTLLTAMVLAPKDSFIIVENPEAHLHPSAQAKMMNELIAMAKERKIQLIVETHSDHILNTSLRAVKERKLEVSDLQVLFFSNHTDEEGNMEARVQNLEVNQLGHILNPPKQFFEQYSLDLRALYAPPSRHE